MSYSNTRLIIEENRTPFIPKRVTLSKGWILYEDVNPKLDFVALRRLLRFVAGIHNKYKIHFPMLLISFPSVKAEDKLTIQVLEIVIYSLIADYGHRVMVNINLNPEITTEGFKHSPLRYLASKTWDMQQFINRFETSIETDHYRRIIPIQWSYNGGLGEYVLPDVMQTLRNYIDDINYAFALAEVITELINNANEHNKSDCLLDLDITTPYHKTDGSEGNYIGVNVSIISFAKTTISKPLRQKITSGGYNGERYSMVAKAYERHQAFFHDNYTSEDFFTLAAFQDKISGRPSSDMSGGTGLTKLLQSLEKYSDNSKCYVVSGNRSLFFYHHLLDYDEDGWVAFNETGNFHDTPPNEHVFQQSPFLFPGVGYNLNFVYKLGVNHEINQSEI